MRVPWTPAWLGLALLGCGGAAATTPVAPTPVEDAAPIDPDDDGDDGEDDDGVELVSDRGRIDPEVAAARVAPHAAALNDCYTQNLARRRWLGGTVELTWVVAVDGKLSGVRLSQSDLGAWPIERCLLEVAAGVNFGKPQGHGPAEVTFPVSFAGGGAAVGWDDDQAQAAVGGKPSELRACAKPGGGDPYDVAITIYVGTLGAVGRLRRAAAAGPGLGRLRGGQDRGLEAARSARQDRQAAVHLQPGRDRRRRWMSPCTSS
jgi:hypothetical protein